MTVARKKKTEDTGLEQGGGYQAARLRAVDVQQVEFRVGFRGYKESEVDEFLDRITEELVALNEENKRLREGGVLPGMGVSEATAEAQEIIRQARAEADALRAAAAGGAVAASGGGSDALAAVYPFLTKEREFLTALGEMVRAHMDAIKADARALQSAAQPAAQAPAAPAAAPAAEPEPTPSSAPAAAAAAATGGASIWEATAAPETATGAPDPVPPPPAEGDVASIPPSDVDTPGRTQGEEEEPSLRDLFWGDE